MTPQELASELIRFDTVSVRSNVPITDHVESHLRRLGCDIERLEYDDARGVRKASVIGKRGSGGGGGLAYFCHTDVVPAEDWARAAGPFEPVIEDGRLYGRGSCDMKGSLACMLSAVASVPASEQREPIYIVCTADEEVGMQGAQQVANESRMFAEMVAAGTRGIIGEPTELEVVHAHKGGSVIRVTSRGRAAHSSTTRGLNANLAMIPLLTEARAIYDETISDPRWQNPEFDPPTICWNIGINDHTHAINITPPQSVCTIYFRKMPGVDGQPLVERILKVAEAEGLEASVSDFGQPLYIPKDAPFTLECLELAGKPAARTVGYGTDGARLTALERLIVCGPGSISQAHTHDEFIEVKQLGLGTDLYRRMIRRWCC
ncbi:MAG: M20 family metallopeptidase [Planctomycetaceae bacterium]